MIALIVVQGIVIAGVIGFGAIAVIGSGMMFPYDEPDESTRQQLEKSIKDAYGDRLTGLSVEEVEIEWDDSEMGFGPFGPFLFGGGPPDEALAFSYGLTGTDVKFANVITDVESLSYGGMLPTRGSISNRLTEEQLLALAKAWSAVSSDPIGGVERYGRSEMVSMEEASLPPTITVGGKDFASKDLWLVSAGAVAVDGKVSPDEQTTARVFSFDPAAKTFVYVADEPGYSGFMF